MSHNSFVPFDIQFTNLLVHDLRAHVRAVNSLAGIVLEDEKEKLSSESRAYLQRICSSTLSLNELVDHIAEISQLRQPSEATSPVSIASVLRHVVEDHQWQSRVDLKIVDDLTTHGDRRSVAILITELLKNALLYSNGEVQCELVLSKSGGKLCIHDFGIGVEESSIPRLFEPFFRLHSTTQYPGAGLGLYKVDLITQLNGWEVSLASEITYGTTATVIFPNVLNE